MNKPQYRLPDGKVTASVNRYVREWRKNNKILKDVYGLNVFAFDPGVCAYDKNHLDSQSVEIPAWFMRRLVELAKEMK